MKKDLPISHATEILLFQAQTRSYQFPSIYRSIPESFSVHEIVTNKVFLFNFLSAFLVMAILLQGFCLYSDWQTLVKQEQARSAIEKQVAYWKQVVTEHRNYRDGYYQLALLSYKLGREKEGRTYLLQAKLVDPNDVSGKVLGEKTGW